MAELRRAVELAEGTAFIQPVLARSLALAGREDEARSALAEAGSVSPYQAAAVHVALASPEPRSSSSRRRPSAATRG